MIPMGEQSVDDIERSATFRQIGGMGFGLMVGASITMASEWAGALLLLGGVFITTSAFWKDRTLRTETEQ